MTKHEFCQIMAAGHEEAAEELLRHAKARAALVDQDPAEREPAVAAAMSAAEQFALANAFRDLAKEHENE